MHVRSKAAGLRLSDLRRSHESPQRFKVTRQSRYRRDRDLEAFWHSIVLPCASLPWPPGHPPRGVRPARGPQDGDRADPGLPVAALHGPLRPQHARPLPSARSAVSYAANPQTKSVDAPNLEAAESQAVGEVLERSPRKIRLPKIAELRRAPAEEDARWPDLRWSLPRAAHWLPNSEDTGPPRACQPRDTVPVAPPSSASSPTTHPALRLRRRLANRTERRVGFVNRRYLSAESISLDPRQPHQRRTRGTGSELKLR